MLKKTEVQFRAFQDRDLAAVQEMHIQSTRRLSIAHYSEEQIAADEKMILTSEYASDLLSSHLLLAVVAENVIGSVGWSHHDQETARIRKMFVSPNHSGQGLGSSMLGQVELEIKSIGYKRAFCRASLNAIPFYEKNGFLKIKMDEMALGNGVSMPVMLMEKSLLSECWNNL